MSYLPENLEQESIIGMSIGDSGYVAPWALFVDKDRITWINGNYSISRDDELGYRMLAIQRTKEGVIVRLADMNWTKYKWSVETSIWDNLLQKLPVELI